MRFIFSILFLCTLLVARENPFFPMVNIEELPLSNNNPDFKSSLEKVDIKLPSSARVLKKVEITFQNLDGSIETREVEIDRAIDWHKPLELQQKGGTKAMRKEVDRSKVQPLADYGFIKFYANRKKIHVITNDEKIRDFLVVRPHKIVIDFKRDASFLTKRFKVNRFPFVNIVLGNHDGYYRVAIELDGQYSYKMKEIAKGYAFELF